MWLAVFFFGAFIAAVTLCARGKGTLKGKLGRALGIVAWPIIAVVILMSPPASDIRSLTLSDLQNLAKTPKYIAYSMMLPIAGMGALWCLSIVEFFSTSSGSMDSKHVPNVRDGEPKDGTQ